MGQTDVGQSYGRHMWKHRSSSDVERGQHSTNLTNSQAHTGDILQSHPPHITQLPSHQALHAAQCVMCHAYLIYIYTNIPDLQSAARVSIKCASVWGLGSLHIETQPTLPTGKSIVTRRGQCVIAWSKIESKKIKIEGKWTKSSLILYWLDVAESPVAGRVSGQLPPNVAYPGQQ